MKFRNGFVSNSSSSSFIVIRETEELSTESLDRRIDEEGVLHLGQEGETEFGWSPDTYHDIWSKLNVAWLALNFYGVYKEDLALMSEKEFDVEFGRQRYLLQAVQTHYPQVKRIDFKVEDGDAYIDHQSVDSIREPLCSVEAVERFVFNPLSYVETDNDNH